MKGASHRGNGVGAGAPRRVPSLSTQLEQYVLELGGDRPIHRLAQKTNMLQVAGVRGPDTSPRRLVHSQGGREPRCSLLPPQSMHAGCRNLHPHIPCLCGCSVLVANNGLAAVKFMRSIRSWASQVCHRALACHRALTCLWRRKEHSKYHCQWHANHQYTLLMQARSAKSCVCLHVCGCPGVQTLGSPRAVVLVALATPDDMRINAEHISLADQFVEVGLTGFCTGQEELRHSGCGGRARRSL
jgi:hypothetical protein